MIDLSEKEKQFSQQSQKENSILKKEIQNMKSNLELLKSDLNEKHMLVKELEEGKKISEKFLLEKETQLNEYKNQVKITLNIINVNVYILNKTFINSR